MCLNCGCGIPDDTMGNDDNLIITDLAKAAIASNMNAEETLKNTKEALDKITSEELQQKIDEVKIQHQ